MKTDVKNNQQTGRQLLTTDNYPRKRVKVLDSEISYIDAGTGDPIVFLHGNPTSSYLWRNIIPFAMEHGRCLAPDLVGMGKSGKSPSASYRFIDHSRYLDAWFEELELTVLPKSIMRTLSEEEMEAYREPFKTKESRLPTLLFPRELSIDGDPVDVTAIVQQYGEWISKASFPKLLISAEPGALLVGRALDFCRTWPNQEEVTVKGIHYIQEDSPNEIGEALDNFLEKIN